VIGYTFGKVDRGRPVILIRNARESSYIGEGEQFAGLGWSTSPAYP